jgi:hypothetical protein
MSAALRTLPIAYIYWAGKEGDVIAIAVAINIQIGFESMEIAPSRDLEEAPCLTWNGRMMKCPKDLLEKDEKNVYYWNFFLHRMHNRIADEYLGIKSASNRNVPLSPEVAAIEAEYVKRIVYPLFENSVDGEVTDSRGLACKGRWFLGTEVPVYFEATIGEKNRQFAIADSTHWIPDVINRVDSKRNKDNAYILLDEKDIKTVKNAACSIDHGNLQKIGAVRGSFEGAYRTTSRKATIQIILTESLPSRKS